MAEPERGGSGWGMFMSYTVDLPVWAQILLDGAAEETSPDNRTRTALVLLAHGSKDPRWREPFERIYLQIRRESDSAKLAYMEFVGPTLMDVAGECVREGKNCLRVLPLFMASGAHLATDVPNLVREVRERYPELQMEVLPPIGEDPRMVSLMRQIIKGELHRG